MNYYEMLIQSKDQRMELEELVFKTKNITKSDGKFFVKSMIECMAKIKFDKRIKVTYEKKDSRMRTIVFICEKD
ncbi:hypothetical protein [Enterococcus faecalis]|uniref:VE31 n=1 Tax=Enterococcus faecalis TaxID=1351 RepID=Q93A51_ENTFL|nr:hypothetical protein [Enterococcus faecalis]AAL27437.1 VE31 [Enterococcus faecalis]MDE3927522.1 hypothetical protein [Enterococcus faecalis]